VVVSNHDIYISSAVRNVYTNPPEVAESGMVSARVEVASRDVGEQGLSNAPARVSRKSFFTTFWLLFPCITFQCDRWLAAA